MTELEQQVAEALQDILGHRPPDQLAPRMAAAIKAYTARCEQFAQQWEKELRSMQLEIPPNKVQAERHRGAIEAARLCANAGENAAVAALRGER